MIASNVEWGDPATLQAFAAEHEANTPPSQYRAGEHEYDFAFRINRPTRNWGDEAHYTPDDLSILTERVAACQTQYRR